MRSELLFRLIVASLAVCISAAWPCRVFADSPDAAGNPRSDPRYDPPDNVFWHCEIPHGGPSIPPERQSAGRWLLTYLRIHDNTQPVAGTLTAGYGRYLPATDGSKPHAGLSLSFELMTGETLPIFGAMYRVTELKEGNDIRFKRVTDKDFVKNLTDDRGLIIIPVGAGVRYLFYEAGRQLRDTCIVDVKSVTPDTANGGKPSAKVYVEDRVNSNRGHGLATPVKKDFSVIVGDILPLVMGCQLTVTKIVPTDEKRKILGWVEFSPDPPKQKEAAATK
jgi:hypothetical protein